MPHDETGGVETLGRLECWNLLASAEVGRLALIMGGGPEIFPVNHAVDHGAVVFRTAPGTKLAAIRGNARVAFEADGLDPDTGLAWSVVAKGRAERVTGRNQLLEAEALPLQPWHGTPKHWFVRIRPDEVTGRRFPVRGSLSRDATDQGHGNAARELRGLSSSTGGHGE